jgi:hypothetical protein
LVQLTQTEKIYQNTIKYSEWPQTRSNGRKIYQNGHYINQHLSLQVPPKFTQIIIFGLKICHLATLRSKDGFGAEIEGDKKDGQLPAYPLM